MDIPSKFMLGGAVWTVKRVKSIKGALGQTVFTKHEIQLLAGQTPQTELATFCHELVHAILWTIGEHADTTENERRCDRYGTLIHQFLTTKT